MMHNHRNRFSTSTQLHIHTYIGEGHPDNMQVGIRCIGEIVIAQRHVHNIAQRRELKERLDPEIRRCRQSMYCAIIGVSLDEWNYK